MKFLSILQMIINALVKPRQHISIREIPAGRLLDIGGGGEGVVAQAGSAGVIAIDKFMSEIREAKDNAPNISCMVADATKLPYQHACFDNATAFFSCMYMTEDVKENVFRETLRVLKPGGELWIWDVNMPPNSEVFAIRLQVDLPEKPTIKTVYGVKAKDQSEDRICDLLRETGFEPEVVTNQKHCFFIKAKRSDVGNFL